MLNNFPDPNQCPGQLLLTQFCRRRFNQIKPAGAERPSGEAIHSTIYVASSVLVPLQYWTAWATGHAVNSSLRLKVACNRLLFASDWNSADSTYLLTIWQANGGMACRPVPRPCH